MQRPVAQTLMSGLATIVLVSKFYACGCTVVSSPMSALQLCRTEPGRSGAHAVSQVTSACWETTHLWVLTSCCFSRTLLCFPLLCPQTTLEAYVYSSYPQQMRDAHARANAQEMSAQGLSQWICLCGSLSKQ